MSATPPAASPQSQRWKLALAGAVVLAAAASAWVLSRKDDPSRGVTHQDPALPARATSRALDHLPKDCEIAARLQVDKLLALPGATERVGAALADVATGAGAASPKTRDFLQAAGIDPRKDVREIAACARGINEGVQGQKLAIVVAGALRPGAVLAAMSATEKRTLEDHAGHPVARTKSASGQSLFVAQADDGAILVTNDEGFLDALNTASHGTYALPDEAEIALVAAPSFFAPGPAILGGPMAKHAGNFARATAVLRAKDGAAEIALVMRQPSQAADLDATLHDVLAKTLESAKAPDGGRSLLQLLLDNAKLAPSGDTEQVRLDVGPATLEAILALVAKNLREANTRGAFAL